MEIGIYFRKLKIHSLWRKYFAKFMPNSYKYTYHLLWRCEFLLFSAQCIYVFQVVLEINKDCIPVLQ